MSVPPTTMPSTPVNARESRAPRAPRTRATIVQVAKAANVAPATVSSILNDRPECFASAETRRRVVDTARKMGYRPNPMARALMGKSTSTVGLVVPGLDVEVSSLKFSGFEGAATKESNLTIVATTQNQAEREDQGIRWLMDRYVDAIAVYPTEHGKHEELRMLVEQKFPVVTFDGEGRLDLQTDDVSVDCYAGGRMQVEHLLSVGRRRIGIINGVDLCHITREKIRGIETACADAGLPKPIRANLGLHKFNVQHWITEEFNQIGAFLQEHAGKLDAIAGLGDILAMAAIRCAAELGIRVPQDLAVIGYDGLTLAGHTTIPLTTITHPSVRIGEMAFELLLQRMASATASDPPKRVMMPPELVVRASTVGG